MKYFTGHCNTDIQLKYIGTRIRFLLTMGGLASIDQVHDTNYTMHIAQLLWQNREKHADTSSDLLGEKENAMPETTGRQHFMVVFRHTVHSTVNLKDIGLIILTSYRI